MSRTAALPAAVLVMGLALTACGTQRAATTGASAPSPSVSGVGASCAPASPTPSSTVRIDGEDGSKYAENHMYRATRPLSDEQRCAGEAKAAQVTAALDRLRRTGTFGAADVRSALVGLGYASDDVNSAEAGTGRVAFSVEAAPLVCLEGSLDGSATDVEVHGMYLDGGCTEPPGGH